MQREKLYKLQRTANFTTVIFLFKIDKILSDQISMLRKRYVFSLFHLFLPDMFYLKNQICYKMQREMLYNLHKDGLFYSCAFCSQNRQISERLNFVATKKSFFGRRIRFFLIYQLGCFLRKTKYTARCSAKSSTNYKEQRILYMHLLF